MKITAPQPDPLTGDWWAVRRWRRQSKPDNAWDDDCDCGAPPSAYHCETCSVTPIYATCVQDIARPRDIINALWMEFYQFRYLPIDIVTMTIVGWGDTTVKWGFGFHPASSAPGHVETEEDSL